MCIEHEGERGRLRDSHNPSTVKSDDQLKATFVQEFINDWVIYLPNIFSVLILKPETWRLVPKNKRQNKNLSKYPYIKYVVF